MKIDNFKTAAEVMRFDSPDDFYQVEIIQRKKDLKRKADLVCGSNEHTLYSYIVSSLEMFERLKKEIVALCDLLHARAYINLNRKSKKKTAMILMKEILTMVENDNYNQLGSRLQSSASQCSPTQGAKRFMLDIDSDFQVDEIKKVVESLGAVIDGQFKTPHGWHLLTTPFNTVSFWDSTKKLAVEVKHNSPVLLYYSID